MCNSWQRSDSGPSFEIRRVDLDDWADIRNLHGFAFARLTAPSLADAGSAAFLARIREPEYTASLQERNLLVACIDRQLVGTAGWEAFDQRGRTACIRSVCVSPLFTRLGIGRHLVAASEASALQSGYRDLAARAFPSNAGFFEDLGYTRSSQDVHAPAHDCGLPIVHMRKGEPGAAQSHSLDGALHQR